MEECFYSEGQGEEFEANVNDTSGETVKERHVGKNNSVTKSVGRLRRGQEITRREI